MTKKQRVIVVGGGDSIRKGIQKGLWEKIKGEEIWSCNYAFMSMPYLPQKEIWVDVKFWKDNCDKLQELFKQGVEMVSRVHNTWKTVEGIDTYLSTREASHANENTIFYGRMGLSGAFALGKAVKDKWAEIYILGFDFGSASLEEKQTHYYQGILNVQSTGMGRPEVYRMPDNRLKREVEDFKEYLVEGVKIINVSPQSNIPYFEKIDYDEFFRRLLCQNG